MALVPVLTVTSLDRVLRDTTAAGLLCDLPGAVVLSHDLTVDGTLTRVVYDRDGTRDHQTLTLDHGCLSCALREDVLPTLHHLISDRPAPPTAVILALPVTAEALPLVRAVQPLTGDSPVPGAAMAAVLAAVDTTTLVTDLLGDDQLIDRGLHLSESDRRSVGEALAQILEYADLVVTPHPSPTLAAGLLAHLVGPTITRRDLFALDPVPLLSVRRRPDDPRGDLRQVTATGAADTDRLWSLDLHSWRPFHPDRLHRGLEQLGAGPIRGRGVFWLPTRPHQVGAWDGAGGQLSIGAIGTWSGAQRHTHLVITGLDHDPALVRTAFEHTLLTEAELGRGLDWWATRKDNFDPWFGEGRLSA